MSQHITIHCPSCNAVIAKNYCAACGEKKRSGHDLTVKHFLQETIEGFTHFDGSFFRTIKFLFFRPGRLTENFEAGKRVNYMKPFQLFLVSNLLFFLVAHGPNLFATSLSSFYNYSNYTRFGTRQAIDKKLAVAATFTKDQKEARAKEIALVFNEKIVTQSKAFIVIFIPLLALGFALFFFRKKKLFSLHLVFATHFFSFVLLYFIVYFFLVEIPVYKFLEAGNNDRYDNIFGFSSILIFICYLFFATRRFYRAHITWCILSSIGISVFFFAVLNAYRLFLFYKIINSIS
jgi:hypothetical protein